MASINTSVRFDERTMKQLLEIQKIENDFAEKIGARHVSRNDIICAAVNMYYTHKIDQDVGDEYMNRIANVIRDTIKMTMDPYDLCLNKLLYGVTYNKEALLNLLKTLPIEKNKDAVEDLVYRKRSVYENPIDMRTRMLLNGGEQDGTTED